MDEIRSAVREAYGKIAASGRAVAGCCATSCCTPSTGAPTAGRTSKSLGYSDEELTGAPDGSNLGLGCGNPQAIAALKPGETVLDLGSGGGFDCFLAARQVGSTGSVIGVDMTPEMVTLARENAAKAKTTNVDFRLGEIERLPVADETADAVLSNCVINLSPDKPAVYREAFRVLKAGGRLAISDVVATAPLPEGIRRDVELHVGCVAGAATIDELEVILADVGFREIRIRPKEGSREAIQGFMPGTGIEDYVVSATIEAKKP
jgi:SAM-dependent methyltransferase